MIVRDFIYEDLDGSHWPDAELGSELIYAIDASEWSNREDDTITKYSWFSPNSDAVTIIDSFVDDSFAYVKLGAYKYGTYKIYCNITSEEAGIEQKKVIEMLLTVL